MPQVTGIGYYVVPDALRKNATAWEDVQHNLMGLVETARNDWNMNDGDMGIIGRNTNFVKQYNEARNEIIEKVVKDSYQSMETKEKLDNVATTYEDKDAEYYKKFGYLSGDDDSANKF